MTSDRSDSWRALMTRVNCFSADRLAGATASAGYEIVDFAVGRAAVVVVASVVAIGYMHRSDPAGKAVDLMGFGSRE